MNSDRFRPVILILLLSILLMPLSAMAQDRQLLTDFWKIGDKYTYDIMVYGTKVGHSSGTFLGVVKHEIAGNKFLFRTETLVGFKNGNVSSQVNSDLLTQSRGYPTYYSATYKEKEDSSEVAGYFNGEEFAFQEEKDTTKSEFTINISPYTVLCDRQSIPQWNLAFFNKDDLDQDTIVIHAMIPYLKKRAIMMMTRQPDDTIPVMGKATPCKVFFSLRTDEYYYITPDHHVALVSLPKQGLKYELASIEHVDPKVVLGEDRESSK